MYDFDPSQTDIITLDDFLAGRLDKAVPADSPEGQRIMGNPNNVPVANMPWDVVPQGVTDPRFEHDSPYSDETVDEYVERMHATVEPVAYPSRHPNSARFHELLEIAGETHDQKQLDYGKGGDPFANVRASEDWGVEGWVGAMVRLTDKVKRLQSLRTKGYLANESAKDSFMDIAVYALIAFVLYEQSEAEGL